MKQYSRILYIFALILHTPYALPTYDREPRPFFTWDLDPFFNDCDVTISIDLPIATVESRIGNVSSGVGIHYHNGNWQIAPSVHYSSDKNKTNKKEDLLNQYLHAIALHTTKKGINYLWKSAQNQKNIDPLTVKMLGLIKKVLLQKDTLCKCANQVVFMLEKKMAQSIENYTNTLAFQEKAIQALLQTHAIPDKKRNGQIKKLQNNLSVLSNYCTTLKEQKKINALKKILNNERIHQ